MGIVAKPMRASDVRNCAAIVVSHPVYAARYGRAAGLLAPAWRQLLDLESFRAVQFCDTARPNVGAVGVGVSAFVRPEFLLRVKTPPLFWLGPELLTLTVNGDAPLLNNGQMRTAMADGGLDLVVWVGLLLDEYERQAESYAAVVTSFLEQHRGFPIREVISQAHSGPQLEGMARSGALLMDGAGNYQNWSSETSEAFLLTPHCVGLTRELALARPGTWVGALFSYRPPRCGFTRSEQRLLLAALHGGTDAELAAGLKVSVSAVKKGWLSIYARARAGFPDALGACSNRTDGGAERGREKKQRLLAYVREHPEELRPALP